MKRKSRVFVFRTLLSRLAVTLTSRWRVAALHSFQDVLRQLQQKAYVEQQMRRPGLLGIAPNNMPTNPLNNPNLQIAILAVMMATQLQQVGAGAGIMKRRGAANLPSVLRIVEILSKSTGFPRFAILMPS